MKCKKGSPADVLLFMVMAFVIVVFFGLWVYAFGEMTDVLTGIDNDNINISGASEDTFGVIEPAQETGLHILSYAMIIAMAVSILVGSFIVKSHPAFLIVYVLVVIGAIIGSVYISNQYEDLMQNEIVGDTLSDFRGGSFILLYLPLWVTIVGLMGALFMFMGILRDAGAGGSIM